MQLTSDQKELQDVVRRFFQDCVPSEYLRARMTSLLRRDEALWGSLQGLGLDDGFGGNEPTLSFADLGIISEEVGRSLFPEPLVEYLFSRFVIPGLLSESRKAYTSLVGEGASTALAPEACSNLVVEKKTKRVSGSVSWAFGGEGAAAVLAVVRLQGHRRVVAFKVDAKSVVTAPELSLDRTTALTSYRFEDASGVLLSVDESSRVLDCFEILKACEVYGAATRVLEMTVDYVKTREQFGVPVGAFQAIQHRLADAYAASESLGALARFASWSVASSPSQTPLTAKAAIAHAAEVGPMVCESAMQCHGGIGFTWEYDLHLYLRRVKAIQAAFPLSESSVEELLSQAQGDAAH